jgi:hypothetical protein
MSRPRDVTASPMADAVRRAWPEYLMEAAGLGLFMLSACGFTVLLFHPASPATRFVPDPFLRRALIGLAMGLTAVVLVYSPLGKRSGAHLLAQFVGGLARGAVCGGCAGRSPCGIGGQLRRDDPRTVGHRGRLSG